MGRIAVRDSPAVVVVDGNERKMMSEEKRDDGSLEVGDQIQDRYTVEGKIGKGGFATVYIARDKVIERPVAIKVLKLSLSSGGNTDEVQRTRKRFLREARLAARIGHQSIVDIYDFGLLAE